MTIDASTQIALAEGTALPAPRAFGETNTVTFRRARPSSSAERMVVQLANAAAPADGRWSRVSVVAADPSPLTITF